LGDVVADGVLQINDFVASHVHELFGRVLSSLFVVLSVLAIVVSWHVNEFFLQETDQDGVEPQTKYRNEKSGEEVPHLQHGGLSKQSWPCGGWSMLKMLKIEEVKVATVLGKINGIHSRSLYMHSLKKKHIEIDGITGCLLVSLNFESLFFLFIVPNNRQDTKTPFFPK